MFFQGVMERVLVELALPTPFPPLPSSPTTPQPLSYHPHKIRKSRKNRIAFSPGTSLNLLYQQLALNSLRIQSPSTISTPISKFNFFDDISKHLFFYPSILFSWTLFLASTQSHSPFISLSDYQRTTPSLSQWIPFCYSLLSYILYSLSSYTYSQTSPQSFLFPLFPITASSDSHIYYHSESPNVSIHSHYCFLSSRQKSPKSKKSQIPFYITNGFFSSEELAFKQLLSVTCFTSRNNSSQSFCSSHIVEGTFVSVQLFID